MQTQTAREQEEALQIVRGILRNTVDPERITIGEAKTYSAILLDGNPWKTICRLYFCSHKSIGVLNTRRVETKSRIYSPDDLLHFARDFELLVKKYT